MPFKGLTSKLTEVFDSLRGKGKLTEKDVKTAMREVRLAMLEADVNFKIVKEFEKTVMEKAVGDELFSILNPGQHVVKIVHEELIRLMGGEVSPLTFSSSPPTVYMMVGLQGAGKTTASGKLAGIMKKQNKNPLLVACDIYRPAAIKQLEVVGATFQVPVFSMGTEVKPQEIVIEALKKAAKDNHEVVIIDTAGRLHIDEGLMEELIEIKEISHPQEVLLVIDAMTGQDAVNVAESFNKQIGIDGIIITKLDGDTRGGAALSVREITGKPVKFVGTGEKISTDTLEAFHPDRMASRILGMGDMLSLIEKAEEAFDEKNAMELEKRLRENEFGFDDFLEQMAAMQKMGPLQDLLGMIPGMNRMNVDDLQINDKAMGHVEAIILSMTPVERRDPDIINGSRRRRIAGGSGRNIQEVNRLLKQFKEMRKMMKQMTKPGKKRKMQIPFL